MGITKTDRNYALYPPTGGGCLMKTEQGRCPDGFEWKTTRGTVDTVNGIARVYSNSYKKWHTSSIDMIKDGRSYSRFFEKYYTARGLVTKAKEFSNEIYGED